MANTELERYRRKQLCRKIMGLVFWGFLGSIIIHSLITGDNQFERMSCILPIIFMSYTYLSTTLEYLLELIVYRKYYFSRKAVAFQHNEKQSKVHFYNFGIRFTIEVINCILVTPICYTLCDDDAILSWFIIVWVIAFVLNDLSNFMKFRENFKNGYYKSGVTLMNNIQLEHTSIITRTREMDQEDTCIICYDRQPNTNLQPCTHRVFCLECLQESKQSVCPICREPITKIETTLTVKKLKTIYDTVV
jgi:hypothetical protein